MDRSPSVVSVEKHGHFDWRNHKIMSSERPRMQEQKIEVYHSWHHGFEVTVGFDTALLNA